jgi:hypothetical protein
MQIIKNIPIPEASSDRISWPFKKMAVGDCVKITDPDKASRARVYCHVFARQAGLRFATRTIENVLHVWRVA